MGTGWAGAGAKKGETGSNKIPRTIELLLNSLPELGLPVAHIDRKHVRLRVSESSRAVKKEQNPDLNLLSAPNKMGSFLVCATDLGVLRVRHVGNLRDF